MLVSSASKLTSSLVKLGEAAVSGERPGTEPTSVTLYIYGKVLDDILRHLVGFERVRCDLLHRT